jgi:hypothetical protein
METDKAHTKKIVSNSKAIKKSVNPFDKLIEDKERIADAVNNSQSLSSLKDIKFVRPL